MSRIGKLPISIPDKCEVKIEGSKVQVKGPLGTLFLDVPELITVEVEDKKILIKRGSDLPTIRSKHGLIRSLINNMVDGVIKGYEKRLELVWPGGKVKMEGNTIKFDINFIKSEVVPPEGITIKVERTKISVSGIDKQKVGEVAAKIRAVRRPEPYKQKGIKYENEVIRKKAGKAKV